MNVVIVGGGIAGLRLGLRLLEADEETRVTVLEAQDRLGGRIHTVYNSSGQAILETGAWRIPSTHRRMISLCKELELELIEVESENADVSTTAWLKCAQEPSCNARANSQIDSNIKYGISMWDALAAQQGVPCAEEQVAETGYAGADAMALGTNAYDVEAIFQSTKQDHPKSYWVPKAGLSAICGELASRIRKHENRACIHLQSRAIRVETLNAFHTKRFRLSAMLRVGKNSYCTRAFECDSIVLAIPPEQAKKIAGVQSLISPVLETLQGIPLFKAFCVLDESLRTALGLQAQAFHIKANNLCQQLISSTYPNQDLIQLAYCSGQRADALEHFRLCGKGRSVIANDIARIALDNPLAQERIRALLRQRRMRFYYWKNAVHIWRPTVASLQIQEKSREACVLPHTKIPGVFLCGEAYSTMQGWSEGALETVEHVYSVLGALRTSWMHTPARDLAMMIAAISDLNLAFVSQIPRHSVVLFGRLLDVTNWKKVHPGSRAAIENHLGEDVSYLFEGALHPSYARGIGFALQYGWLQCTNAPTST